jgi:hypothetical protein
MDNGQAQAVVVVFKFDLPHRYTKHNPLGSTQLYNRCWEQCEANAPLEANENGQARAHLQVI